MHLATAQTGHRHITKEYNIEMDNIQQADTEIRDGMNAVQRAVKRILDLVLSALFLLLLSPVFLVVAFLIKRHSEGPVFFRQERIGYGGRPFQIVKFRTMPQNFESDGVPRLSARPDMTSDSLGRFLREHHMDELPQLWNVLVGEMSFVGPRPERQYFIDQIMQRNPDYVYVYRMRPGLTSMATLYNGYTDTMEKMLIRLQMDLEYLKKRSLWLDTKIVLTTANYLLNGKKI